MDDINRGEVYLVTNLINGKLYIGQALKYVSSNKLKWGMDGRWKSHVREAISDKRDHCLLLNQAIRKYGEQSFEIKQICECDISEMNALEEKYITSYNTLSPNGYNLTTGGSNGKASEESKKRMGISRKNKQHKVETKTKIGQGQIGNRRATKKRKYPEDNSLPKYISSSRKNGVVNGYYIRAFPVGITEPKYISKSFSMQKNESKEHALQRAMLYLDSLKEKYQYLQDEIMKEKVKLQDKTKTLKLRSKLLENLPENISPIVVNNRLAGYYVDGLTSYNGTCIPRKEFTKNNNKYNLNQAMKFVQQIEYINVNKFEINDWSKIEPFPKNDKQGIETYYLPKYINIYKYKGVVVGYKINGFVYEDGNEKRQKYSKVFSNQKYSLQEKYEMAVNHLKYITIKFGTIH